MCAISNKNKIKGNLKDALVGADIFIGVSRGNLVNAKMISFMNSPIVFAMANPVPEIYPEEAYKGGAVICGTGRSDYKNQINNVLAFPGIFKGVLSAKIKKVTMDMMKSAAYAIANMVTPEEIKNVIVIPDALNPEVAQRVAEAVIKNV